MKKSFFIVCFLVAWQSALFCENKTNVLSDSTLNISGHMQLLSQVDHLKDPERDDTRVYGFLKESRLHLYGNVDAYTYSVKLAFGGEEAADKNSSLGLLDSYFEIPLSNVMGAERSYIKAGQFKVPYSRERLTNSEDLLFSSRSISYRASTVGRDVGVTYHAYYGDKAMALGLFTGGGADIPQRYLPETFGTPLFVFRAGINKGLDENIFDLSPKKESNNEFVYAAYISGLYVENSQVGHSTVLAVKYSETSLLHNSNWNPFIGKKPIDEGRMHQIGADFSFRKPFGKDTISGAAEFSYGSYKNTHGSISLPSGTLQSFLHRNQFDYGVRYAFIRPDRDFGVGTEVIHQMGPSISYNFNKRRAKVVVDSVLNLNMPVAVEAGTGSYVLMDQPGQITSGSNSRQTVLQLRTMVQFRF